MKIYFTYFIFTLVLISCNQEKKHLEYAQEKADKFVDSYATKFLNNNKLLRYSYNPRVQFIYEQDSTNKYHVFTRENEINLICFSDSCKLSEPFNKNPLILLKGSYILKQDSIFTKLRYDSLIVETHTFESNPEEYFSELKKQLNKYGVFAFYESKDKSFIKIYLSFQYYLIKSKEIEKVINNDKIIKSYNDNWYFIKMKRQMDLG